MRVQETALPEVLILEPEVYGDARGFFYESYNRRTFHEATGLEPNFVQDNHSHSVKGVLRGLHYQIQQTQGKLVRVTMGEVYDVAVDLRKSAPTFGLWVGANLTANNRRMMWVPQGFAHGFLVLSESAEVLYKATDYYDPQSERCIRWDDPELAIDWPLAGTMPRLSDKDRMARLFKDAELFV